MEIEKALATKPAALYISLGELAKELGYADDEEMRGQISTLKFLSTEDKGYTVEYTVRK
ncbi:MAG: hypothetical protein ABSG92_07605 [Conexivisphaerales archaeon]|jgi:hypothetical protein